MKKILRLLPAIIIIYFIATMALPKFMPAAQENPQEEMYQTWDEFLESGVKIQYDETPAAIDDTNN